MSVRQPDDAVDIDVLSAILMRQWKVVFISIVACCILGASYALTAVPLYTATSKLLINTAAQNSSDQPVNSRGVIEEDGSVLSKVEIIKSKRIAISVINDRDLTKSEQFMSSDGTILSSVVDFLRTVLSPAEWFGPAEPIYTRDVLQYEALKKLDSNLDVSRLGKTYILEISFTSPHPDLAAKITSAFANAYINDQMDSKFEATRRAAGWLEKRIAELRQQSLSSDLAVQHFRQENDLITTEGQPVVDQQLSQISNQLIAARSDAANAEAKYTKLKSTIDLGEVDAAVTDALDSDLINGLRQKYLEASRRETDITKRFGQKHAQSVRLRAQIDEYRQQMFSELSRIAESYRNNFLVSKQKAETLEAQVQAATERSAMANNSQVQLRELEREAETYRTLYQSFLQRYQENVQQQSFPTVDSRVISDADIPDFASSPKKALVMALSVLFGLGLGSAIAGVREYRERYFRTGDQLRADTGLEFLGNVPLEKPVARKESSSEREGLGSHIRDGSSISRVAVDQPFSYFSETMRSIKLAIDVKLFRPGTKIIGVVSTSPNEGKSTVSINLAQSMAKHGNRVLLIDADLRNPGSTKVLAPDSRIDIIDVLKGDSTFDQAIRRDATTGLHFLPANLTKRVPYSAEFLASAAMDQLLNEAETRYDYLVIDLPPLAPVVDARALSRRIDGFIYVVEWGRTLKKLVQRTLSNNSTIAEKCIGCVLNKVDFSKLRLYENFGQLYYDESSDLKYFQDEIHK